MSKTTKNSLDICVRVLKEGDRFVLRDAEGTRYGAHTSREDADVAAEDWNEYYKRPLL